MSETVRAAFWRAHVDASAAFPGRQVDYCREHGLNPRELRRWRTRFHGPMRSYGRAGESPLRGGASDIAYAHEAEGSAGSVAIAHPVIRRRWNDEEKRQLIWDGLNSGQSLSLFAKRHQIHPSVMHRWLCRFALPALAADHEPSSAFAEVRIEEPPPPSMQIDGRPPPPAAGLIEIDLVGGRRVRVGRDVDVEVLRRVVAALELPS